MIYNVVLVSDVQQSDSVIHIHIFFQILRLLLCLKHIKIFLLCKCTIYFIPQFPEKIVMPILRVTFMSKREAVYLIRTCCLGFFHCSCVYSNTMQKHTYVPKHNLIFLIVSELWLGEEAQPSAEVGVSLI